MKVKVRGIYATAITKFLSDNGIEITNMSERLVERFGEEANISKGSATTLIYDKEDLNGVTVSGEDAEKIISLFKKAFLDVAVKKIETGEIYCGKIKSIDKKNQMLLIDLGNGEEGLLELRNYWGFVKEGEKVLVQKKGQVGDKKILSTQLRLFGENAILIKKGFTKISEHIKSELEKEKLRKITEELNLKDWGILWKSLAEGKDEEELKNEILKLIEEEKRINEEFERSEEAKLLKDGLKIYFLEFGAVTKSLMDKIRKDVTNTIVGHHFLKSGGYVTLTDFAESLEGIDDNIITEKINNTLKNEGPRVGQFYQIIHKKTTGKDIILKGFVQKAEDNIEVRRKMHPGRNYDGLDIPIEVGDYAISTLKSGNWYIVHRYYNKDGYPKGRYISINTPIEVYPNFARYIDLEIDVVEKDGKLEVIDEDKFNKIVESGVISEELAKKVKQVVKDITEGRLEL